MRRPALDDRPGRERPVYRLAHIDEAPRRPDGHEPFEEPVKHLRPEPPRRKAHLYTGPTAVTV